MFLLSSAKVAFTNMGPRAKPRLFSVSLTQNFQRGRQVWKTHMAVSGTHTWLFVRRVLLLPAAFHPGTVPPGACAFFWSLGDTFSGPVEATLGTELRRLRAGDIAQ